MTSTDSLIAVPDPYYADDFVTLYHADSRDLPVPGNVLITDPPYGVNIGGPDIGRNGRGGRHGLEKGSYESYDDSYENYCEVVVPVIERYVSECDRGAVFVGPHIRELPKATAVGGVYCPAGSGRHAWGFKTFLPVLFYGHAPNLQAGARGSTTIHSTAVATKTGHPCPKPLTWLRWLVGLAALPGDVVVDPFAGSGTTLRAAKDMGLRCVGIEIEERYCEIAASVCAQEVLVA